MFQDIDLRQLAELEGPERAFLTLYLSGPDALGSLDSRAERIRTLLARSPDELEHFENSFELLRGWLGDHPPAGAGCVFACWALDFVRGWPLEVGVEDRLWIGPHPFLRPLAELQEEYESFAVVAADNRASRIFLVASAVVSEEERVRGDVKNRVKKGGWSQKRYARRRENELMHYGKEVAEALEELGRDHDFSRLVLLGQPEATAAIEEALSEPLRAKVVARQAADVGETREALVEEAFELFFAEERQAEERLWDDIREEYLRGGLAAVGPTDVLKAALAGRAARVAVTRDAKIRGTRCKECENVVHGTPRNCQACGSKQVFEVDLVDEITQIITRTSAEMEFVDPIEELSEMGEMAALLRY
ncbi:MAG TPA: Vms1/Ankzf1 family peptidyl-tRNA hydrolase [Thermoanaerobaculia bacterium]|nr:Vms1/Ankzf1 family peptidyl-tRNA hydrolase [Thermoanaerobaculia bacterium]